MAVYFVTGKLGSGKSLACVSKIRDYLSDGRRVATNLDLELDQMFTYCKSTAVRLPDKPRAEDLAALGPGYDAEDPRDYDEKRFGLIVLDECGTWLNSREWNDKERRKLIDWFLHARKHRWDVMFLIQDIESCDAQIVRSLCEHLVVCRRMDRFKVMGISLPKMHIANVYYGRSTEVRVERWTYKGADLYSTYDTRQVFRDGVEYLDQGPVDMRSSYTMLSAWHLTRRDCRARVNGNYFCRGTGRYTGDECPSDVPTGSDLVPEDTVETPEPQNFKDEQPCIYATDGSKEVCTSSKTDEVEGQICATLEDGSEFCTTKLPEKNGIDISTEVTKETLADGSVKTTKKDTATVTNCVGVNNCTTTKAETTKTTTEDANGNKTGESSTCKGEACPGKGNPDSDGDGVGDCTGDDCGAGGGGEGQDWYTPTGDTFGSVLTEFVGKVQQTPVASQTSSFLTFRATGSCPRWSVSVWVFDIDIDQLCNGDIPWNAIKAVILAAAGFFAFRIALL